MSQPIHAGHEGQGCDLLTALGITDPAPEPLLDPLPHFHTALRGAAAKGGDRR